MKLQAALTAVLCLFLLFSSAAAGRWHKAHEPTYCRKSWECPRHAPVCRTYGLRWGVCVGGCRRNGHCPAARPVCNGRGRCVGCQRSRDCPKGRPVCNRRGRCERCRLSNDSPCSMRMGRNAAAKCTRVLRQISAPGKTCRVTEFARRLLRTRVKLYKFCRCLCDNFDRKWQPVFVYNPEQCHFRYFFHRAKQLGGLPNPCPTALTVPCEPGSMCPKNVFKDRSGFTGKSMGACPRVPIS